MKLFITSVLLLLFAHPVWAIDVWVWFNEEVNLHYKVLNLNQGNPCGTTSEISLTSFPEPDAASEIGMEKVIEFSEGAVVNRWSIPVDKYVLAVDGDSIYVPYRKQALRLYQDGTYEVTSPPTYESRWIKQCPMEALSEFRGSSYVVCHEYRDLQTQVVRRIAYEGPCT
ncbi:MAG: hypothetical protein OIF51_17080 [Cellvibrionaceae bacterium]|nr:hypothetical protein [Cellvibrionaceae bacterium]